MKNDINKRLSALTARPKESLNWKYESCAATRTWLREAMKISSLKLSKNEFPQSSKNEFQMSSKNEFQNLFEYSLN